MSDLTASVEQERYDLEPNASALEQVEALLSGKTIDEPTAPETAPDPAPGGDAAAAKESEVETDEGEPETEDPEDAKAFYAQTFKLSDGTEMTVGEAKDLAQDFTTRQVDLIERENSLMTRTNELNELGQYLNLPPEVRERIQQQQMQHLTTQHHAMLAAIPEFKDQAVFEKGRLAMFDLGHEYGVDLSKVTDHRVVKMLYDFTRLKAGIKSARENVKPIRTPEPKAKQVRQTGRQTELSNAMTRAQTGTQADKEAAVEMLLRS
jgi:hypothetical protein